MNRRDFLKKMGLGALGLAVAPFIPFELEKKSAILTHTISLASKPVAPLPESGFQITQFTPTKWQQELMDNPHKLKLVRYGRRSGKTLSAINYCSGLKADCVIMDELRIAIAKDMDRRIMGMSL